MRRVIKTGQYLFNKGIFAKNPMYAPQGWIVEEWHENIKDWVYLNQLHPEDAQRLCDEGNKP